MGQQVSRCWFKEDRLNVLTKPRSARKYYFVQLANGHSQWEIPTEAAPGVPTPGSTPMPSSGGGSQFSRPTESPASSETIGRPDSTRGVGSEGGEGDRGLGTQAINLLSGGGKHGNQQGGGGIGGLAQSLLSSGSSHGGSGSNHGGGSGGLGGAVGQIAGSLLGGGKQHGQSGQSGHGGGSYGGSSSAPPTQQSGHGGGNGGGSGHSSGGLGGILGGVLGGHGHVSDNAYQEILGGS